MALHMSPLSRLIVLFLAAFWMCGGVAIAAESPAAKSKAPTANQAAASKSSSKPTNAKAPATTKKPADSAPESDSDAKATADAVKKLPMVAIVNREEIRREDLAKEAMAHHGKEVLESLVNRYLISRELRRQQLSVTDEEVQQEIDRLARKLSLPKEQFLATIEHERGIRPDRYAREIIWPTVALRKLAAPKLQISQEEIDHGYESQFGEAVRTRMIVVDSETQAKELRAKAVAKPDDFPRLAKLHSKDPNSAQAGGLIQPIRRHMGDPGLEEAAFALQEGQISPVVNVRNSYVILKHEGLIPATEPDRKLVEAPLRDALRDRKLRRASSELFQELQSRVVIDNVLNDPKKSKQHPGVAAIVSDNASGETPRNFTVRELAEECVTRHGVETLEGMINHRLLEQTLKKKQLTVTQADLDAEIDRAALAMGKVKPNGDADRKAWIDEVTREQDMPYDIYVHDSVWPSAALKKIVGKDVTITEEDMKRGFEANYGPRCRCRAIILHNQRKAQEVWEKARDNPSIENFAKLAQQYSIDANSASLGGEVPPVQKHGGQPQLEREAFSLEPGELSGIVQVGDHFVVLLCEGYTEPIRVEFAEVKKQIQEDLREKKLRVAMAKAYQSIQDSAEIDNLLAGKIKSPKKEVPVSLEGKKIRIDPSTATRKK